MAKSINMQQNRKHLYVVGFPKSGSSWLSRLLGDALNSPVQTANKLALAEEGLDRNGEYIISQLHLESSPKENIEDYRLIHIIRDPRDIVISAYHYWNRPSVCDTIITIGEAKWPIHHGGGWVNFVNNWWNKYEDLVSSTTSYEFLKKDTQRELQQILDTLEVEPVNKLGGVVQRQSLKSRIKYVEKHGDKMPYGPDIQLKLLRKGTVGDWKNYFTRELGKLADGYFGELMLELGYIDNRDWWKDLPKKLGE